MVDKYGDDRRTTILPFDGEVSMEDLIAEEEVVVTITRGGYAKRTRTDSYRAQRRGGKGVRGAQLREDDIVDHFFVTTTHHWLLFFTNLGRVYRAKAYELPEGGRDAKGQHVANLLAFQPGEQIAQVLDLRDYEQAEYLVLATRRGLVKKTRLTEYDSNRSGGVIAINLREDEEGRTDELVSARLVDASDDLILVSRKGQSIRFTASDDAMRPLGRATSGVTGMKFRSDDELLAMDVVRHGAQLFVVTEGGFAKRTDIDEYRVQGRGGLGIKVANLVEARGDLVGALITEEDDEVLVIMERGKIVRSAVNEVSLTGRNTQGVTFARPDRGDRIIAVAKNIERQAEESRYRGRRPCRAGRGDPRRRRPAGRDGRDHRGERGRRLMTTDQPAPPSIPPRDRPTPAPGCDGAGRVDRRDDRPLAVRGARLRPHRPPRPLRPARVQGAGPEPAQGPRQGRHRRGSRSRARRGRRREVAASAARARAARRDHGRHRCRAGLVARWSVGHLHRSDGHPRRTTPPRARADRRGPPTRRTRPSPPPTPRPAPAAPRRRRSRTRPATAPRAACGCRCPGSTRGRS